MIIKIKIIIMTIINTILNQWFCIFQPCQCLPAIKPLKRFEFWHFSLHLKTIITNNTKCILSSNINKTKQWAQGPKALAFSVIIVDDELTKPRFTRKLRG